MENLVAYLPLLLAGLRVEPGEFCDGGAQIVGLGHLAHPRMDGGPGRAGVPGRQVGLGGKVDHHLIVASRRLRRQQVGRQEALAGAHLAEHLADQRLVGRLLARPGTAAGDAGDVAGHGRSAGGDVRGGFHFGLSC